MYVNPDGARIVRLIFHKFVNEHKGTHVIARELLEEGIYPMHIKRWSNTVILRVIRNEKYCGDLVQKKTITPDFLSHEKKYNRGEEEFVIIKDHHEAIISREMFDRANKILDERSDQLKGKEKYSNRYPFSGKIKCGCCGASFVARYKTRSDGSRYKSWRCYEAATHGSPHIDKAGNEVGCRGLGIRNEDIVHIMNLVIKQLNFSKEKIVEQLVSAIKYVLNTNTASCSKDEIIQKLNEYESKQAKLLDIYVSGDITKEEFRNIREKYDDEIMNLKERINLINEREYGQENNLEVIEEISSALKDIINGIEYDEVFYGGLTDKIVVNDKDNIDVYLKMIPHKWSYTLKKALKHEDLDLQNTMWNIDGTPVPTSVSMPTTSL